jgi:hypothetical protein
MTRAWALTLSLILAAGLALGCSTETGDASSANADESGDGKVDCHKPEALITEARAQLRASDPSLAEDAFNDDGATATSIGDLDADGSDDFVVAPGSGFFGANTQHVIFLSTAGKTSQAAGCPAYAGDLGGVSEVEPAEDMAVTNGVRDIITINNVNCEATFTRYTYDGSKFVAGEAKTETVCDQ